MALPYSVEADILEQIPSVDLAELTNDVDGSSIDSAIVTSRISKGDTLINSYIRGKNTVPGDPVATPILNEWSVDLAIYYLYKRRVGLEIPDGIKDLFDEVMVQLKAVRDGSQVIDDATSFNNTSGMYKSNGKAKGCLFTTNAQGTGTLDEYYNGPLEVDNRTSN